MPIYEYACLACGHEFEKLQRISEVAPPCPLCASEVRKLVSASGFILKGSGWYKDHYGLKNSSSQSSSESSAGAKSGSSPTASTGSEGSSSSTSSSSSGGSSGSGTSSSSGGGSSKSNGGSAAA